MVILSFNEERLAEHSHLTLKLYLRGFGEPHERVLARKIYAIDRRKEAIKEESDQENLKRILEELVGAAIRLACLLHDVGKSLKYYQERRCREGFMSFPYHELVSAYVAREALEPLICIYINSLDDLAQKIITSACLAIMFHHQAMRSIQEYSYTALIQEKLAKYLEGGCAEGYEEEVKLIFTLAEPYIAELTRRQALTEIKDSTLEALSKLNSSSSVLNEVLSLVELAGGNAFTQYAPITSMMTAPLQLADNLAASLLRPGGRPLSKLQAELLKIISSRSKNTALASRSS